MNRYVYLSVAYPMVVVETKAPLRITSFSGSVTFGDSASFGDFGDSGRFSEREGVSQSGQPKSTILIYVCLMLYVIQNQWDSVASFYVYGLAWGLCVMCAPYL